ncbi:phage-related tail protein [Sphingomonas jinjuensis]|uniref:Phage-related tail protein n=1 Tax=Sphingomonas jinjuensis TaxID=535907 RepID=A0A840FJR1_9SPHN|nr:hypothetical protein [Sphingomonas jinjuensis]MBB4154198.1 phage-related tail protein [Sphingomonas jinjuensis]
MKRLLSLALAASLCACTALTVPTAPPSPAAVADATRINEKALAGVELAYKAAAKAETLALDAGLVSAAMKPTLRLADQQAYAAVRAARAAYKAGNVDSYSAAIAQALTAIGALGNMTPT